MRNDLVVSFEVLRARASYSTSIMALATKTSQRQNLLHRRKAVTLLLRGQPAGASLSN